MDITTSHAQITVKDSETSCGANINRRVSGYVADLHFWGDSIWLARRKGETGLHLMIAPSDRWKGDIEAEGFEIIGKLSDLANSQINGGIPSVASSCSEKIPCQLVNRSLE